MAKVGKCSSPKNALRMDRRSQQRRGHTILCDNFFPMVSLNIEGKDKKKFKKKNHDFVFLFKQASERMHCWVSAPRMQPVGICLNQDILTAGFINSLQEHLGKLKFNILT